RPIAAAVLAIALAAAPVAGAEPRPVDGIAAVVDGVPITAHAVRARAAPALEMIRRGDAPAWQKAEQARAVLGAMLDAAIEDALFAAAAREDHVSVSDASVDEHIDRAAAAQKESRA